MFQLDKTIVSEEVLEKQFMCNLSACKGACCIDGDAGAPVEESEKKVLEDILPKVKKYLRKEGKEAIEKNGPFTTNEFGEHETTLIDGADCAFVTFDENEVALCAIEEAYNQGEIDFKKPISCHMYPVRIKQYSEFAAVNYHHWEICDDACSLGSELKIPVFQFVKQALIRKFGEKWYKDLEKIAETRRKEV